MINPKLIKKDFPIFNQPDGKQIIYLDNASTSQKPESVIAALNGYYREYNANVHRGVYALAELATERYEAARQRIARALNAHSDEIIFTRGTTDSINAVASMLSNHITAGDEIVVTELEHHSNFVPWQRLAQARGAVFRVIPINPDGTLQLEDIQQYITPRTKVVAISQVSNVIGVHNDIERVINHAHSVGAYVLVDAAQSIAHQSLDLHAMGADFVAFSGHKMVGPTGIGVLFIARKHAAVLEPYQVGGGMVFEASINGTSYLRAPYRFEAGTPPIAEAIGLAAAFDYLATTIDMADLQIHEAGLTSRLIDGLSLIKGVRILGPIEQLRRTGHMVSFVHDRYHPHDIAAYLSTHGICVRAGHHCAQPLAKKLAIDSSLRVSFYLYNSTDDVDLLIRALEQL